MKKLLLILLLVVNVKASECNYNTKVGRFLQESLQNVHDNLGSEEKYQLACRGANEWHKTLIRLKPKRYYSQIDLNEQVRALNVIYA